MKNILVSALILNILFFSGYAFMEPSLTFAASDADTLKVTLNVTGEVSITHPSDVTMSPSIGGVSGGTSDGYAEWTIICSNAAGFTATMYSSSTAMVGDSQGDQIDAYTEAATGTPDYTWSVSADAAEFGYTATTTYSSDLDQSFLDNGSACNTGTNMTDDHCYISATSSAAYPETLMNRSSETDGSGVKLYIHFKAEIGSNHPVTEDTYTSTSTITVTTN